MKNKTVKMLLCAGAFLTSFGLLGAQTHPQNVLSFAILGDCEPKPEALFPNLSDAVDDTNRLVDAGVVSFAIGVGDLAHKGTLIQYVGMTPHLRRLKVPFYPIMGNEEHGSTVERFLEFAALWNQGKATIEGTKYVLDLDPVAMVFASPDFSRQFNDESIDWILATIDRLAPKPVFLIVHGAQVGVYQEAPDKGIEHPRFASEVVARANLAAVISGDLHMDMDRVKHSKKIGHVHYLHVSSLERTKVPDETRHVPMFRVVHVMDNGEVRVHTYQTGNPTPLDRHDYSFVIPQLVRATP
jgi:3',5'-cyclic-AMP phosphodiesterase